MGWRRSDRPAEKGQEKPQGPRRPARERGGGVGQRRGLGERAEQEAVGHAQHGLRAPVYQQAAGGERAGDRGQPADEGVRADHALADARPRADQRAVLDHRLRPDLGAGLDRRVVADPAGCVQARVAGDARAGARPDSRREFAHPHPGGRQRAGHPRDQRGEPGLVAVKKLPVGASGQVVHERDRMRPRQPAVALRRPMHGRGLRDRGLDVDRVKLDFQAPATAIAHGGAHELGTVRGEHDHVARAEGSEVLELIHDQALAQDGREDEGQVFGQLRHGRPAVGANEESLHGDQ